MGKVISLQKFRDSRVVIELDSKIIIEPDSSYVAKIQAMSKIDLLEEMVDFQSARNRSKGLTPELIKRALPLFEALAKTADSAELRILSQCYFNHLLYEK